MITLQRFEYHSSGTPGRLFLPGDISVCTLEERWLGNAPGKSCIPSGQYPIFRDLTGKFQVWRVEEVPGRSLIEFHSGNTTQDTEGCILLGDALEFKEGSWRIPGGRSKHGVNTFIEALAPFENTQERLMIFEPL